MPKKLLLSSIILHAAAIAMAILCGAMIIFSLPLSESSAADAILERHRLLIIGVLVAIAFWIADIALLANAKKNGTLSRTSLYALYISVIGDLACGLVLLPSLLGNSQNLPLGVTAGCLFVANFVLRILCAVKLAPFLRRSAPVLRPAVLVTTTQQHLSLAAALTGIACFLLGVALFYVISDIGFPAFYEKITQVSQNADASGAAYLVGFIYFILMLAFILFIPVQFASLVFLLCILIALFLMAAGKKRLHMLALTIALWVMEVLAIILSTVFLSLLALHPAVIVTDVLFFLAWTAQAILCTVLTVQIRRHSANPQSAIRQETPASSSAEKSSELSLQ